MVMKPEPIFAAVEDLRQPRSKVLYMAPDGVPLTSQLSRELAQHEHIIILSGHYEGVDQRVRDEIIDLEVSIGDYVLTNGTLAAAVLVEFDQSVPRLPPRRPTYCRCGSRFRTLFSRRSMLRLLLLIFLKGELQSKKEKPL